MSVIWVQITATRGSTPRDTGTAMAVTRTATKGTIGGGALELEAIRIARDILARNGAGETRRFPLGPDLGQCCGGVVTLRFSREACVTDLEDSTSPLPVTTSHRGALWLWGAGHVGRAVVRAGACHAFQVTWVDSAKERFPANIPKEVNAIPAANMPLLAARAPQNAHHLIFTYSHDIDLALCAALLKRDAASIGLIGSATKKARFFKRLSQMGLDPHQITCPIGDKAQGKAPQAIATSTLAALLRQENRGALV